MKLWSKDNNQTSKFIDEFTVGDDRRLDLKFFKTEILGSIAHLKGLEKAGLMTSKEADLLSAELKKINLNPFKQIEPDFEDIHSKIEFMLTESLGDIGKKVHTGRSRNDQVQVNLRLYLRTEGNNLALSISDTVSLFLTKSEQYKNWLLPGFTHWQPAMPSSFGLWYASYAEAFTEHIEHWQGIFNLVNRCPLGSGAGYGSSLPLEREYVADLLSFEGPMVSVAYVQNSRRKLESLYLNWLADFAATIAQCSIDAIQYLNPSMRFLKLPAELTTGSSIMPHKQNPDLFELLRAKANRLIGVSNQNRLMHNGLGSGYNRDFQESKALLLNSIDEIKQLLEVFNQAVDALLPQKNLLQEPEYDFLYTVEAVNQLVLNEGFTFRDAYHKIAAEVKSGQFKRPEAQLPESHTAIGTMGNLGLNLISGRATAALKALPMTKIAEAEAALLKA